MAAPIFHDPSGRRKRRAAFSVGLLVAAILAIFAAFAVTLALAPHVPSMSFRDPRVLDRPAFPRGGAGQEAPVDAGAQARRACSARASGP